MTRVLRLNPTPAPLSAPAPNTRRQASDMADLFHLAFAGWLPSGAGSGLEALFDRMEAGR